MPEKPLRRPLSARPLDLLYFIFFLIHIPATLLLDLQALYPPALVPHALRALSAHYVHLAADPLIAGALGRNGPPAQWAWFRALLSIEAMFQLPVFIAGAYGLRRDSRAIYPLLLAYAASACSTTLPCLAVVLATPVAPAPHYTPESAIFSVTPAQRVLLLSSYIPFLLVPLLMGVDMLARVTRLVRTADARSARKNA